MFASYIGLNLKYVSNFCTQTLVEHLDDPSKEGRDSLLTLSIKSELGRPLGLFQYLMLLYSWKVIIARVFFSTVAYSRK